jgi:hypothetical protein
VRSELWTGDPFRSFPLVGRIAESFQDESDLGEFFAIRFNAYLTDATVEIVKRSQ